MGAAVASAAWELGQQAPLGGQAAEEPSPPELWEAYQQEWAAFEARVGLGEVGVEILV